MKKHLFTLILLIAGATGMLSQSIPNGGFESWIINSYENPMYYSSSNNEDNDGIYNVTKVSDPYHGSYAVRLATVPNGTNTQMAYIANGDPMNPAGQGIPYNQQATGISFRYKMNTMPNDSALVWVIFKKAGGIIGNYIMKLSGTQTTYALKSYTFALAQSPDSLIFAAASSDPFTYTGPAGSTFQLDSVNFTGVASQPVNFNGSFELWQTVSDKYPSGWSMNTYLSNGNFQTTDFYSGAYALELQTYSSGTVAYSDGATNGVPSPSTTLGGSPYSNQNDTLIFYYKYFPTNSNDSAMVSLNFKKNFAFFAAQSTWLPASSTYKKVKMTINLGTAPDTLLIFINSSKNWSVAASYAGAILKIDNMYLTSQMAPVTNFSVANSGCASQTLQLNDNSYNLPSSYTWTMTGGSPSTSTSQNPVVTYTAPGTYTISHNTSNSFGSGSVVTETITINALPVLTANSATICSGQSINLFANGAPAYAWSNGPTTATISVSPTVTTNYTVVGTATTGCSSSAVSNVLVNAPPTLSLTSSSPICAGTSTNFFVSGASTYSWSTGATTNSISVSPTITTQYGVVGTNTNGCQNTATVSLTVNPSPTVTASSATICAGQSTNLVANGAATYLWSNSSTSASISVSPTITTSYTVTGTATNSCSNYAISNVIVNAVPSVTISNASPICAGTTANLIANGASTYSWSTGATTNSISVSPATNTVYGVVGTGTNSCQNTATVSLTVNPSPTLSVTGPNNLCVGNTIILNVSGASTYTWVVGPTTSTIAVSPTVSTSYSVTGTATNGCIGAAYMTVTVNPSPTITAVSNASLICTGQSATLTAGGGTSYTWTPGGVASSIVVNPTVTSTYTLIGTDALGCNSTTMLTQSVSACTGIAESQNVNSILIIYPNPNNGSFSVKSNTDDVVVITNELGQQIIVLELNDNNDRTAHLTDMASGIYFAIGKSVKSKILILK